VRTAHDNPSGRPDARSNCMLEHLPRHQQWGLHQQNCGLVVGCLYRDRTDHDESEGGRA